MAGRRKQNISDSLNSYLEDLYQEFENACKASGLSSRQLNFLEWSEAKRAERASDTNLTENERELLLGTDFRSKRLVYHRKNWQKKKELPAAEVLAHPGTSLDVHFRA